MKKLLICILCFSAAQSFAQVRFGVQGSFSSLNFWQGDQNTGSASGANTWAINGWQGGVYGEYDLGYSGFELQSSLSYGVTGSHLGQSRGFTNPSSFITYGFTNTTVRVYAVRLPVNLLYRATINNKIKIFAGLGPYFAKNLSGREKGVLLIDSTSGTNSYPLSRPINDKLKIEQGLSSPTTGVSRVNPIDIGLDVVLGIQYKKWQYSFNYNRGFTTLYSTNRFIAGNTFWNFTVGYQLFGKERSARL